MKPLKFAAPLIPLVLSGQKDTTWRINDDKDFSVKDQISCRHLDGTEFAQAQILWVKTTTFANLSNEDRLGHEPFSSEKELYKTYKQYYGIEVDPTTIVKVIKFKLIAKPNALL